MRKRKHDSESYVTVKIHPELHRVARHEYAEGKGSIQEVINVAVAHGLGREDLIPRIGLDAPAVPQS